MGLFDKLFQKDKVSKKTQIYDLETVSGILSIQIPKYDPLTNSLSSPVNNIEYILQRKATEHDRAGKWDEAIACLRKSNEIMPNSNFMWTKKDYMRLVDYLKKYGAFDAARCEKEKIDELFSECLNASALKMAIGNAKQIKTDLLESTDISIVCAECSALCRRIFSISGNDRQFPALPLTLTKNRPGHEYCILDFYPFLPEFSEPNWKYKGNLTQWCSRPYVDERGTLQKKVFYERVFEEEQKNLDTGLYGLLCEKAPSLAPKSFGGFRRMKNLQSQNFMKIAESASDLGIDLNKKSDLSNYKF